VAAAVSRRRRRLLVAAGLVALTAVAAALALEPERPRSAPPAGATWSSGFDGRNPWAKWEGYAQPLQILQGGAKPDQIQVVTAASAGVPAPPGYGGDAKLLLTQVSEPEYRSWASGYPAARCCPHAKLYHVWGPGGEPGDGPALRPGEESGSYRVWYYLPADTPTFPANDVRWVNLMEWKSAPAGAPGDQVVDGGAALLPIAGRVWICLGRAWPSCYPPSPRNAIRAPLGRWFELRADFHHASRVDWYIDAAKVWTSTTIGSLEPGHTWIFGIGHYGGVGRYYVKSASFTPFGR
jgi:hypothetical protein